MTAGAGGMGMFRVSFLILKTTITKGDLSLQNVVYETKRTTGCRRVSWRCGFRMMKAQG